MAAFFYPIAAHVRLTWDQSDDKMHAPCPFAALCYFESKCFYSEQLGIWWPNLVVVGYFTVFGWGWLECIMPSKNSISLLQYVGCTRWSVVLQWGSWQGKGVSELLWSEEAWPHMLNPTSGMLPPRKDFICVITGNISNSVHWIWHLVLNQCLPWDKQMQKLIWSNPVMRCWSPISGSIHTSRAAFAIPTKVISWCIVKQIIDTEI